MALTYLDSCIVIHATEETSVGAKLRELMMNAENERFAISPLVRLESLIRPLRTDDLSLHARRVEMLDACTSLEISERCFGLATHIRARHGLDTADALHLAAAGLAECDRIWTTDRELLAAAPGFAVDVLGESA